jgi:hypothetical protein
MHSSIVLMVMTRCAAVAALTLALTLAPSLRGGDIAEARAVKEKTCLQKYFDCVGRCNQRAIDKYGPTDGNDPKHKTVIEANNCERRTCMPQWNNCEAAAKKKSTKSEQPPKPPVGSKAGGDVQPGGGVGTKP